MRKTIFILHLVIICLIACNPLETSDQKIEEKFRNILTEEGNITYGNYFTQLAGLRGEVVYSVFTEQGETNPDIKIIQVDIDKKDESAKYKTAKIQYQFNSKSGYVKLAYLEVNGKSQSLFEGAIDLGLMMMESSLK